MLPNVLNWQTCFLEDRAQLHLVKRYSLAIIATFAMLT